MKKIIVSIFLGLLLQNSVVAQKNLVVFTDNGERFWLILSGIRQNNKPETNVKVTNLTSDFGKMKVVFENEQLGSIDKNYSIENGFELKFIVKQNKKKEYTIRPFAYYPIGAEDKNQVQTPTDTDDEPANPVVRTTTNNTNISTNCTFNMSEAEYQALRLSAQASLFDDLRFTILDEAFKTTCPTTEQVKGFALLFSTEENRLRFVQNAFPYVSDKSNYSILAAIFTSQQNKNSFYQFLRNSATNPITPTTISPQTNPRNIDNQVVTKKGCTQTMSNKTFSEAQNTIQNEGFDETKFKIAKQIISSNCPTTAQVKVLAQLFSFEETKLDFAKFAYDFTTDKNNYFKINDIFSYSNSKEELTEYISKK